MAIRYISSKSTYFHPDSQTNSYDYVLIYGDEVDTINQQLNGRDKVKYRRRLGWVRSDRLMNTPPLELYFVDVGQGDSVFIVTPDRRKILIDGGQGDEAFQFLVWKYRLDQDNANPVDIDLMVVSHADDDHIAGLVLIIKHQLINVQKIVHSGIAKFDSGFDTELGDTVSHNQADYLITRHNNISDLVGLDLNDTMKDWRTAINDESNLDYQSVDFTTGVIDVGDSNVSLNVLGPRLVNIGGQANPVFPWFGSAAETVNGHSVVLRLDYKDVRVVFPGDINKKGARHLMADPNFEAEADAHLLKAPHHGSHQYDLNFLQAVHPQISVVSSGESPDHGHPRANFLGVIGKVSRTNEPLLFSTELVAQFAVDPDAEAADADYDVDPTDPAMLGQARRRFKKRLNGIINVRTNGNDLYASRRVAAGYQFVTYKQVVAGRDQ